MVLLRIRTRDGTERLECADGAGGGGGGGENGIKTISDVQDLISKQPWGVPVENQSLSLDPSLLLRTSSETTGETKKTSKKEVVLLNPRKTLKSLQLKHGDIVYMTYPDSIEREVTKMRVNVETKPFGAKRTIEEMISKQVRIGRQERGNVASVSFCGHAANMFQSYVNNTLGFKQSRFGWLYGTKTKRKKEKTEEEKEKEKSKDASSKKKEKVEEERKEDEMITELFADVIYEPNQNGNAYVAHVDEEDEESQTAEAIANAMGYERIGCVFSQSDVDRGDESVSAMSAHEVTLCAKLQAKHGKEFVTVIVVQFEDEDEEMQVTFEAFQVSDQCVKLYEDGFFELDEKTGVAKLPASSSAGIAKEEKEEEEGSFSNWGSHTKLVKPVMVERKDVTEVDNDFWIVAVPIKDHTGTAQSGFPIENRLHPPQTADDIRSAIQSRSATCSSYAEKLRDFHLLLFLSKQMDKNDVLAIAESTNDYIDGGDVSEGYKVLIDAIAGIA